VKRGDLSCQLVDDRRGELAALRDPVQPRLLIETHHLQQPFDRFSRAGKRQRATILTGHRHEAPIEHRRGSPVELELGFERTLAALERGVIEEAVADGALHLVGALADQENDGGMGRDALDCCARHAKAAPLAEERDQYVLRNARSITLVGHPVECGHCINGRSAWLWRGDRGIAR
jgi:hypothetical protein